MARLVQRADRQLRAGSQMLRDEPADDTGGLLGVPHGMIEQPLSAVRGGVPGMLGNGPAVLAWQLAQQRRHIPPGLSKGLWPGKTRFQPGVQLGQGRHGPLTGYPDRRSRLR